MTQHGTEMAAPIQLLLALVATGENVGGLTTGWGITTLFGLTHGWAEELNDCLAAMAGASFRYSARGTGVSVTALVARVGTLSALRARLVTGRTATFLGVMAAFVAVVTST
mmetsp:Transcript_40461/g.94678  ORF Transcript_40461/g.94678 Transcript_40461/m.94678 type:complete len:111 (-) Transcript_40461:129-461(-)